jgi:GNAT superfamily N-acetyltransferase
MHVNLITPSQHDSLVDLLRELHTYYNEGSAVSRELVHAYLTDHLLAPDSSLRLVVASDDEHGVIGFAAIFLTYSLVDPMPEKRRQCWLKELYVREGHRSGGAGRALMTWVAQYAVQQGCSRIDWPVKDTNVRGRAFYESLGGRRVAERLAYRLAEPELSALAREGAGAISR